MAENNNGFSNNEEIKKIMEKMRAERMAAATRMSTAATKTAPAISTLKSLFNKSRENNRTFIGKGSFGHVRKITNKNRKPHAIKRVIFDESVKGINNIAPSRPDFFNREVEALTALKSSPYVIQLENSAKYNKNAYFMTELLEKGTSLDSLDEVDDSVLLRIVKNLIYGLSDIHKKGYLHLDIKPQNIWIFTDGSIKYLDFGLACRIPCVLPAIVGTYGYMYSTRKIANSEYKYDKLNDFYALAKTLEFMTEIVSSSQKRIIVPYIEKLLDLTETDDAISALKVSGGARYRKTRRVHRL